MKQRDILVLIVCALTVMLSFPDQLADFDLRHRLRIPQDTRLYANGHAPSATELPPQAVVTDVDGDGRNELIIATRYPSVEIWDVDEHGQGTRRTWVSLFSSVAVSVGRKPVAIKTGYRDAWVPEDPRQVRTQIIVVVTDGWAVLCFDHTLKLLWESQANSALLDSFYHKEIAILIGPTPINSGDNGFVIVGGSMDLAMVEVEDEDDHAASPDALNKEDEALDMEPDLAFEIDDAEQVRALKHFSFYAFDAGTGAPRWKHEAGDFHEETPGDEVFYPQHNYKLELKSNLKHLGESDWREFRASMLHAMPHRWRDRDDTQLRLARFDRRAKVLTEQDEVPDASRVLGVTPEHLKGTVFEALVPHSEDEHVRKPNVVVAQTSQGVEVVHLYSGRTVCQLTLAKEAVYADINGDAVIDEIKTVGGRVPKQGLAARVITKDDVRLQSCYAYVNSGVPVAEPLFNGTLCQDTHAGLGSFWGLGNLIGDRHKSKRKRVSHTLRVAAPAVFRRYDDEFEGRHRMPKFDTVFHTSTGKVTAYSPSGDQLWHMQSAATFKGVLDDYSPVTFTGIDSYPLQPYGLEEHILLLGDDHIELVNLLDGSALSEEELEAPAVARATIGDINNDGWNDVVVVTASGIHGYTLDPHPASRLLPVLVGILLAGIAAVPFVINAQNAEVFTTARKKRTD